MCVLRVQGELVSNFKSSKVLWHAYGVSLHNIDSALHSNLIENMLQCSKVKNCADKQQLSMFVNWI